MRYRKKPIEIEARQWDGTEADFWRINEWIVGCGGSTWVKHLDPFLTPDMSDFDRSIARGPVDSWAVITLEGQMQVSPRDFIIKGVKGEFYPCKPDIFEASYDAVDTPL